MAGQCRWAKDQRAAAKLEQKTLLAVAVDGCHVRDAITGNYEQTGPVSEADARMVFFFACAVFDGKTPDAAFKAGIKARVTKRTAKRK